MGADLSRLSRALRLRQTGGGRPHSPTGLLGEPRGGVWHVFSGRGIDVEHEKKVDLGFLGGADCHGLVRKAPFSTVDGL